MYEVYVKHFYYLKKGEANVKNKFKAGDLVFELDFHGGIKLETLKEKSHKDGDFHKLSTRYDHIYSQCGRLYPSFKMPHLLHATPEMREKLVAIWGEDAVPKLPLRGSELTKRLLEKQEYVLCWVSVQSDDDARRWNELAVIDYVEDEEGWFTCINGEGYNHAVPVDNNGNEITEIE